MAIIIDEKARAAIGRRRANGRNAALFLRVERVPGRGAPPGGFSKLAVGWAPYNWPDRALTTRTAGDVVVCMDARVPRYVRWHDATISAWRPGSIVAFTIDPLVVMKFQAREHTHPTAR